jgi:hypothetical protein
MPQKAIGDSAGLSANLDEVDRDFALNRSARVMQRPPLQ